MQDQDDGNSAHGNGRRNFLKLASISAPAAIATLAGQRAEAEEETITYGKTRLRSTPHTRAYFKAAKF
jgi:hypothetical protein